MNKLNKERKGSTFVGLQDDEEGNHHHNLLRQQNENDGKDSSPDFILGANGEDVDNESLLDTMDVSS